MIKLKIPINTMTQEEIDTYLMKMVECAFREGVLYEKCKANKDSIFVPPLQDAIKSCQMNLVIEDNL